MNLADESPQPAACPQCGTPLPARAPEGLCPACLLKRGLESDTVGYTATGDWQPLGIEQLADHFPELEIIELIGRGGMGAVYKARQKNLGRTVALKILPPQIGRDFAFAARFTQEAQAMARLNHPHIVAIHDFGHRSLDDGDSLFYFLMEYVDGLNLRALLNSGNVSPAEALGIVPQICDALQFAHDHGIVHRDIKPENILLSKQGQVKIADFGLAKLVGQTSPPHPVDQGSRVAEQAGATDAVMGTPDYMAPEQAARPADVDHRADIYALGVVFYQLLTGELPRGNFQPPSKKVLIDVRLDEVVLRALEREPALRYQHASEIRSQVETIVASHHAQANRTADGAAVKEENKDAHEHEHAHTPASFTAAASSPRLTSQQIERARDAVKVPAIALRVIALINAWVSLGFVLFAPFMGGAQIRLAMWLYLAAAAALFALAINSVIYIGAVRMEQLRSYQLAMTAGILALIAPLAVFVVPLPGVLLGAVSLAFGIWTLVVLSRPDVREAFDHQAEGLPQDRTLNREPLRVAPVLVTWVWHAALLLAVLLFFTMVGPRMEDIFEDVDFELPRPTQIVLNYSRFLVNFGMVLLPTVMAADLLACLAAQWSGGRRARRVWSALFVALTAAIVLMSASALYLPIRSLNQTVDSHDSAAAPAAPPTPAEPAYVGIWIVPDDLDKTIHMTTQSWSMVSGNNAISGRLKFDGDQITSSFSDGRNEWKMSFHLVGNTLIVSGVRADGSDGSGYRFRRFLADPRIVGAWSATSPAIVRGKTISALHVRFNNDATYSIHAEGEGAGPTVSGNYFIDGDNLLFDDAANDQYQIRSGRYDNGVLRFETAGEVIELQKPASIAAVEGEAGEMRTAVGPMFLIVPFVGAMLVLGVLIVVGLILSGRRKASTRTADGAAAREIKRTNTNVIADVSTGANTSTNTERDSSFTTSFTAAASSPRSRVDRLDKAALVICIAGVLLAGLLAMFGRTLDGGLMIAYLVFVAFQIAAFVLGVMTWAMPMGKAAAITSGVLLVGSLLFFS